MSPEVIGKIIAAVIIAAISILLFLFRDWLTRRRASSPQTDSIYNKITWGILITAAVAVAVALLYAALTADH